eukprot:1055376-Rhodomonas_salina.2
MWVCSDGAGDRHGGGVRPDDEVQARARAWPPPAQAPARLTCRVGVPASSTAASRPPAWPRGGAPPRRSAAQPAASSPVPDAPLLSCFPSLALLVFGFVFGVSMDCVWMWCVCVCGWLGSCMTRVRGHALRARLHSPLPPPSQPLRPRAPHPDSPPPLPRPGRANATRQQLPNRGERSGLGQAKFASEAGGVDRREGWVLMCDGERAQGSRRWTGRGSWRSTCGGCRGWASTGRRAGGGCRRGVGYSDTVCCSSDCSTGLA